MRQIHPTALVDPTAELADDVMIGPYAIIGPHVVMGPGCSVGAHAVVTGRTTLGSGNRIFQFASIGEIPQDKKYAGEPTRLEIGDQNTFREYCTVNLGTAQDAGVTRIGHRNWFMAYCHVAHDCVVGDHTVFANSATLAGHVIVGDHTVLGGFTGVHQYCRVGAHVIAGVGSVVLQDIPPFVMVGGNPTRPHGINSEGLRRRGFSAESIAEIKRAYKTLYRSGLTLADARSAISAEAQRVPELRPLAAFIAESGRGIIR
jgi:UDP-N-acetylglucosamine acyltransferase